LRYHPKCYNVLMLRHHHNHDAQG